MGDYQGSKPVQTVRDDEFKIKIVDFASGGTATAGLKIETDGSVNVRLSDGTDALAINADGSVNTVASHTTSSTKVGDGTDFLAINADGSINVVASLNDGAEVVDYGTSAAVAAAASANFDYVVTDTKTFKGSFVTVGARGACKVEIGTWNGTTFTPLKVVFQAPAENNPIAIPSVKLLGDATAAIRVTVTNQDKAASDLYCTIEGAEF